MPLYVGVYRNPEARSAEALEEENRVEFGGRERGGFRHLGYWTGENGTTFWLCEAPNKKAAERVYREVHGKGADDIFEVKGDLHDILAPERGGR